MTQVTQASELTQQFSEQGYVILHGFFEPAVVEGARDALGALVEQRAQDLLAAGKIRDPLAGEPFETRLYRLYADRLDDAPMRFRPELHRAGLFPVFFHPGLLDIVEVILGEEILLYPNYTSRPKYPGLKRAEVLWHQDGGYTEKVSGGGVSAADLNMVNVWAPLVAAHEEQGCMQFIPGSHRLGSMPHAPHPQWKWLEIAREQLEPRIKEAVSIELDPGDVVLFHNMLFHQGLPNRSKIIRWNLDWRYLDAAQPTLRKQKGHLARSRRDPSAVVRDGGDWERRSFS